MLSLATGSTLNRTGTNHYVLNSVDTASSDKNKTVSLQACSRIESGLSICTKQTYLTLRNLLSFLCREHKYTSYTYECWLAQCGLQPDEDEAFDKIKEILNYHETTTFTEMVGNIIEAIKKNNVTFNEELISPKAKLTAFMVYYTPTVKARINSFCKAPSLSLIHDKFLEFILEAFNIDTSVFTKLSTPMEVTLEKDKIINFMTEKKLNDRVLELQEGVTTNGWKGLECPELSVVLINITRCIEVTLPKLADKSKRLASILTALTEQAEALIGMEEKIPYADTMCLCIKYSFIQTLIDLLDFPDAFFYATNKIKPSEDDILADCNSVLTQTLTQLPSKMRTCKILCHRYSMNSKIVGSIDPIDDIQCWIDEHPNLLMWPTFAPLTLTDFSKMSRYDVYPAGLSTEKASFHDGLIMLNNTLFGHDFLHAKLISDDIKKSKLDALPDSQEFSTQARQDFYEAVEYVLGELNLASDPMILHAIDFARFVATHEADASNHYKINNASQKASNYLSSKFIDNLFNTFAHFELHKDLLIEHVQIALFVMTLISFGQLYSDDFPELQPPKSDEASGSIRNPATLGITFA